MVLVVIAHTKGNFFSPSVHSSTFVLLSIFSNAGVPLFVMLTGYLMFDRKYDDDSYLQKYIFRNFMPLVIAYEFWNLTWNILRYTHVADEPQKWIAVLKAALFMGDTLSALWYLPMSIALYLGLPILSMTFRKITLSSYRKLLFVALVISGTLIPSIAPMIAAIGYNVDIHSVLRMNIFGASVWGESVWMIYLLAGYAVYKGKLKSIKTFLLIGIGVITPIAIMYAIEHTAQTYDFIFIVVLSISVFELMTRIETMLQIYPFCKYLIVEISKISFAVYMMHIYVGGAIYNFLKSLELVGQSGESISGAVGIIFYFIYIISIVFVVQFLVILLKKSDFIRRYVLLIK